MNTDMSFILVHCRWNINKASTRTSTSSVANELSKPLNRKCVADISFQPRKNQNPNHFHVKERKEIKTIKIQKIPDHWTRTLNYFTTLEIFDYQILKSIKLNNRLTSFLFVFAFQITFCSFSFFSWFFRNSRNHGNSARNTNFLHAPWNRKAKGTFCYGMSHKSDYDCSLRFKRKVYKERLK